MIFLLPICSYEFIRVTEEDVEKYGLEEANYRLLVNGVSLNQYNAVAIFDLLDAVFKQEADFAPIGQPMTHEAFLRVDISVPVLIEPYGLIVPWPNEESRLLAPIRPFQPMVIMYK